VFDDFKWLEIGEKSPSDPPTKLLTALVFNNWEVVQLVGLQILDLAILVRVQASQPILSLN
jgi:hypothetical protein